MTPLLKLLHQHKGFCQKLKGSRARFCHYFEPDFEPAARAGCPTIGRAILLSLRGGAVRLGGGLSEYPCQNSPVKGWIASPAAAIAAISQNICPRRT